jgi:hypothetical protein
MKSRPCTHSEQYRVRWQRGQSSVPFLSQSLQHPRAARRASLSASLRVMNCGHRVNHFAVFKFGIVKRML